MTLSALLCFTFTKKLSVKKEKKRAWLFWTQCTRKVYRLLLISKRVFNEWLHILVLFFFICLFVNFDFGTSLFFHQENGTQYIYSAELSMDTWLFQVSVCVWAMLWSCLRFLLNTATSSRFPTGNKLFLKNSSAVCVDFFQNDPYE